MPHADHRSAKTGQFVTEAEAEANPDTTVLEEHRTPDVEVHFDVNNDIRVYIDGRLTPAVVYRDGEDG